MKKSGKITAMVLSGVMMLSHTVFAENAYNGDNGNGEIPYEISVSEGLARSSVQFDGSKKNSCMGMPQGRCGKIDTKRNGERHERIAESKTLG